ncbi:hypothetical protein KM043_007038 [Ampulex compressa]|nr:hypothetical protein KM043_007038 [Ampulex compressa]
MEDHEHRSTPRSPTRDCTPPRGRPFELSFPRRLGPRRAARVRRADPRPAHTVPEGGHPREAPARESPSVSSHCAPARASPVAGTGRVRVAAPRVKDAPIGIVPPLAAQQTLLVLGVSPLRDAGTADESVDRVATDRAPSRRRRTHQGGTAQPRCTGRRPDGSGAVGEKYYRLVPESATSTALESRCPGPSRVSRSRPLSGYFLEGGRDGTSEEEGNKRRWLYPAFSHDVRKILHSATSPPSLLKRGDGVHCGRSPHTEGS